MPSHSTHINYCTRPTCMGLVTLKIPNFAILIRVAGLKGYHHLVKLKPDAQERHNILGCGWI